MLHAYWYKPAGETITDAVPLLFPTQVGLLLEQVGAMLGYRLTSTEALPVQPLALVTVTVNVPAEFTEMVCVVAPVDQLYPE